MHVERAELVVQRAYHQNEEGEYGNPDVDAVEKQQWRQVETVQGPNVEAELEIFSKCHNFYVIF